MSQGGKQEIAKPTSGALAMMRTLKAVRCGEERVESEGEARNLLGGCFGHPHSGGDPWAGLG